MTFTGLEFLFVFLPLTFAAYFASKSTVWRNGVLFVASILFYAWGEPVFIALMLFSVGLNWLFAMAIDRAPASRRRTALFTAAVAYNIVALFSFKYVDFALSTITATGVVDMQPLSLPLPLGISFYSFQALAYLIDLYRGEYRAERNPVRLTLVIAAFPTITAGPILRYKDMRSQLDDRAVDTSDVAAGVRRILIGVGKKVLIANYAAMIANRIFQNTPSEYGAAGAWLGAIAWTLQIYFDFAGYTDMAVGIGRILGFRYPENFDYPYIAQSVSDFWRRWHMSLSSFFRDYVYIPLGGNRVSSARWVFNMFVVWGLTGLWHGAAWNFVAWGVYYGVLLVLERFVLARWLVAVPRAVRHAYVLLITVVGWVMFMSPSFSDAGNVYAAMVGRYGSGSLAALELMGVIQPTLLFAVIAGIVGSTPWARDKTVALLEDRPRLGVAADAGLLLLFAISVAVTITSTFNPFIYVRF